MQVLFSYGINDDSGMHITKVRKHSLQPSLEKQCLRKVAFKLSVIQRVGERGELDGGKI